MAARNGMLIRDRIAMESARNLDTVVFDKTGTLTEGEQGVVDVATADQWGEDDVLTLAAAAEGDSEHVIAQAIRDTAADQDLPVPGVRGFEALEGGRPRDDRAGGGPGRRIHCGRVRGYRRTAVRR